jgi:hypothetical protein
MSSALYLEHQPVGIWTGSVATRRLDSEVNCLNSSDEARIEQSLRKHDSNSPSSNLRVRVGNFNAPVVVAQHHLILLIIFGRLTSTLLHEPKLCSLSAAGTVRFANAHRLRVVLLDTGSRSSMGAMLPKHRSLLYLQWLQSL